MANERRTVADLIKARKQARAISDTEAARELNVRQATFNRWKNGQDVPTDDRLSELAAWLDMPEDTVALAMVHGRRNRPPADRASAWVEVLDAVQDIAARLDAVERRLGPEPDSPDR